MLSMNEEFRYNDDGEYKRGCWSITAHSLGAIGAPVRRPEDRGSAIALGHYVPDKVNIDTCLNCKRTRCTGNCKKIKKSRKDKRL